MSLFCSPLTQEDKESLKAPGISNFTNSELSMLFKRFLYLDRTSTGYLTEEELYLIPELSMNPLSERIIALFMEDGPRCNFTNFVRILWLFSPRCPATEKQRVAFRIFDYDSDGFISVDDIFRLLKMMSGEHLSDEELWTVAKKNFALMVKGAHPQNAPEKRKINFEGFKSLEGMVKGSALMNCCFDFEE